ncbi:MAG: hypothetical protein KDA60_20420, partial [Planctomycetales bacterium]|nr:hypothetical protein [Planctomycetales bacterium]
ARRVHDTMHHDQNDQIDRQNRYSSAQSISYVWEVAFIRRRLLPLPYCQLPWILHCLIMVRVTHFH